MNDREFVSFILGAFLTMMLCLSICFCVVTEFEKQAIKHGAAIYHPVTGDFTWKDCQ